MLNHPYYYYYCYYSHSSSYYYSHSHSSSFASPDRLHVTVSLTDGTPARLSAINFSLRRYQADFLHMWQLKSFWANRRLSFDDVDFHSFENIETEPPLPVAALTFPLRRLVDEMRKYRDDFMETVTSHDGVNELGRFWLRKTRQPVLAVLMVKVRKKKGVREEEREEEGGGEDRSGREREEEYVFHRGINTEVSMPTGSLCAERNAIGTALAGDLSLRRSDMQAIAVLSMKGTLRQQLRRASVGKNGVVQGSRMNDSTGAGSSNSNSSSSSSSNAASSISSTMMVVDTGKCQSGRRKEPLRRFSSGDSCLSDDSSMGGSDGKRGAIKNESRQEERKRRENEKGKEGKEGEGKKDDEWWKRGELSPRVRGVPSVGRFSPPAKRRRLSASLRAAASVPPAPLSGQPAQISNGLDSQNCLKNQSGLRKKEGREGRGKEEGGKKGEGIEERPGKGREGGSSHACSYHTCVEGANPIEPCGVCNEWLRKVAEANPRFRVLGFTSAECQDVFVRPVR